MRKTHFSDLFGNALGFGAGDGFAFVHVTEATLLCFLQKRNVRVSAATRHVLHVRVLQIRKVRETVLRLFDGLFLRGGPLTPGFCFQYMYSNGSKEQTFPLHHFAAKGEVCRWRPETDLRRLFWYFLLCARVHIWGHFYHPWPPHPVINSHPL